MTTENKNLQFRTNINFGGCVAKETHFLNEAENICHWEVDTTNKDKMLSLQTDGITKEEVLQKFTMLDLKLNC